VALGEPPTSYSPTITSLFKNPKYPAGETFANKRVTSALDGASDRISQFNRLGDFRLISARNQSANDATSYADWVIYAVVFRYFDCSCRINLSDNPKGTAALAGCISNGFGYARSLSFAAIRFVFAASSGRARTFREGEYAGGNSIAYRGGARHAG
jgi:hypothetical protein